MKNAGAEQRVEREQGRDDPTNGAQRSGSSVWCRFRRNTAPVWPGTQFDRHIDCQPPAGIFGSAPDKSSHEHQRKADRLLHRRSPLTSRGTATPPASRAARETPHALTSVVVPEPTPSTWRSAHAPGSTYPAIDMPPARPPTNLNIVPCRLDHGEPPHAPTVSTGCLHSLGRYTTALARPRCNRADFILVHCTAGLWDWWPVALNRGPKRTSLPCQRS